VSDDGASEARPSDPHEVIEDARRLLRRLDETSAGDMTDLLVHGRRQRARARRSVSRERHRRCELGVSRRPLEPVEPRGWTRAVAIMSNIRSTGRDCTVRSSHSGVSLQGFD